ncbi:MAG: amidase, partial [Gemmatimonadota bacterium]
MRPDPDFDRFPLRSPRHPTRDASRDILATDLELPSKRTPTLAGALSGWLLAAAVLTVLPACLPAQEEEAAGEEAGEPAVTVETLRHAQRIPGLDLTDEELRMMVEEDAPFADVNGLREAYEALRELGIENSTAPALLFRPLDPVEPPEDEAPRWSAPPMVQRPDDLEEVAFWPVSHLGQLLRSGQATSVELTEMYLDRLERHDATLHTVITLTRERALERARQMDREMARGEIRGPLHGIPYGVKDLFAVEGYPTTWGAEPYREQTIDETATVVEKLDEAGAVLVAKLTLGALAWGDVWYGEQTRNPWNPEQGSSGSSAGSAAAVSAGLVPFALGTETLGSIVSPATRVGITGLRPSFGRVSRHGAMALSWSMDKVGPLCR